MVNMQDNSIMYCHFQRPQAIAKSSQGQPLTFCSMVLSYLDVKMRLGAYRYDIPVRIQGGCKA